MILEKEQHPGYHATGRSAALFAEIYGNAVIRALTTASRDFFRDPPEGFSETSLFRPRGVMMLARSDQLEALQELHETTRGLCPTVELLNTSGVRKLVPVLREQYAAAAVYEPNSHDIEVSALHQGFLKGMRKRGGELFLEIEMKCADMHHGGWMVETNESRFHTRVLINASGAWADRIALTSGVRPLGITPKRRSVLTFSPPQNTSPVKWPAVVDVEEQFYFKPEADQLLGSPADETPVEPCDVRPTDWDLAVAVDRIEKAVDFKIPRAFRTWAGLRTFASDKSPVVGYDKGAPGFFWLVGQGGYGIQTSPALSHLAASLVLNRGIPEDLAAYKISESSLSPDRFQK